MSTIFISLLVVVVGFLLSFGGSWFRDSKKQKEEKRSITSALLVELRAQANWCKTRGSRWNLLASDPGQTELKEARLDRPPRSEVYEALVGRMTLFEPEEIAGVTAFYGAVDAVRSRLDAWSVQPDSDLLEPNDIKDLAQKWRAACYSAGLAIETLERSLGEPQTPNESMEKAIFMREIKKVAEGGTPLTQTRSSKSGES